MSSPVLELVTELGPHARLGEPFAQYNGGVLSDLRTGGAAQDGTQLLSGSRLLQQLLQILGGLPRTRRPVKLPRRGGGGDHTN